MFRNIKCPLSLRKELVNMYAGVEGAIIMKTRSY